MRNHFGRQVQPLLDMHFPHGGTGLDALRRIYLASAVVWLPLCLVTPWAPLIFMAQVVWWRLAWSECHKIYHGVGGHWPLALLLCPWAWKVLEHHHGHHERPTRNYGTLFFWTDIIMGTYHA